VREAIARVVKDSFYDLLIGEYDPAMQAYEHRRANRDKVESVAVDRVLALPAIKAALGSGG
jgi:hypothetical protein